MLHPMFTVYRYRRTPSNGEVLQQAINSANHLPMIYRIIHGFDLFYAACFGCGLYTYPLNRTLQSIASNDVLDSYLIGYVH